MLRKYWKKCVNYENVSYLICGALTTAVDLVVYDQLRIRGLGVEIAQALTWVAAVFFAYVVNKLIVFRNYNVRPSYLLKESGAFVAARALSGVVTWLLMVAMVRLGGGSGRIYEWFCKISVSAINLILNYVFSKLWVFKEKPE